MKNIEKEMIHMVNKERIKRGYKALQHFEKLCRIAQKHSWEQLKCNNIYHVSPIDQSDHSIRLERNNYIFKCSGENVAMASNLKDTHLGLMKSPRHYKNIIGDWEEIGVGIMKNGKGQLFVTQLFAVPAKRVDTEKLKEQIKSNIQSYRSNHNLDPVQFFELSGLRQFTTNRNTEDLDTVLDHAFLEAENKNINYSDAYILTFSGYENEGAAQQSEMLKNPSIKIVAFSINQDPDDAMLHGVFLFFAS